MESLSLDNNEMTMTKYYNKEENYFNNLPLNNDIFVQKDFEEILEIDDMITIVVSNEKNPRTFIVNDISFLKEEIHKRMLIHTPKECDNIITKLLMIVDETFFEVYFNNFLKIPKTILEFNKYLISTDFLCLWEINNGKIKKYIDKILINNLFDEEREKIIFKYQKQPATYIKRKFNFESIQECIDSNNKKIINNEDLLSITEDYYNSIGIETGITNNNVFYDERNNDYYKKYQKIETFENEDIAGKKLRILESKKENLNKIIKETKVLDKILEKLKRKDLLNERNNIIKKLFRSDKYFKHAMKNYVDFTDNTLEIHEILSNISNAMYISYMLECNSSIKIGEGNYRNYTTKNDLYIYNETDISSLNIINNINKIIRNDMTIYSTKKVKNCFIPLRNEIKYNGYTTLPIDYNGRNYNFSINEINDFRERLEIFSRGLFKDFDWMDNEVYLTGSCITACLIKFNKCLSIEDFKRYINENYKNSDIDISTNSNNLIKLMKQIYNKYLEKENEGYVTIYSENILINKNINERFDKINYYKCKECKEVQDDDTFDKCEKHKITCGRISEILNSSYRYDSKIYKISIKPLNNTEKSYREIDIYINDLGKIGLYHLPIVRATYTGEHIYMYPSFVCSALTGICTDYKWFKGKKNPLSIILDKWMKGFNIILNEKERIQLLYYFYFNYDEKEINKTKMFRLTKWRYKRGELEFKNLRDFYLYCKRWKDGYCKVK